MDTSHGQESLPTNPSSSRTETSSIHEYQIIERMAAGSFGVVFKVERKRDGRIFVMKRIPLENLELAERQEAVKEFYVMSQLCHPHIVHQYDAFLFNENDLCLIMAYYDGGDMDRAIRAQREDGADAFFPLRVVMFWLVEMLLAVHYLHSKGIIHKDLKTHNIFFDSNREHLAVGDFGISEKAEADEVHQLAHSLDISYNTLASLPPAVPEAQQRRLSVDGVNAGPFDEVDKLNGLLKGTPLYMAPETLQGTEGGAGRGGAGGSKASSTVHKGDVWSIGCMLFELLSLHHPFYAKDLAVLVLRITRGERAPLPSHYPPEITELVDKMLTLDPKDRWSCKEALRSPVISAFAMELLAKRPRLLKKDAQDSTELEDIDEGEEEGLSTNSEDFKATNGVNRKKNAASLRKQLFRLKLVANPNLVLEIEEKVKMRGAVLPSRYFSEVVDPFTALSVIKHRPDEFLESAGSTADSSWFAPNAPPQPSSGSVGSSWGDVPRSSIQQRTFEASKHEMTQFIPPPTPFTPPASSRSSSAPPRTRGRSIHQYRQLVDVPPASLQETRETEVEPVGTEWLIQRLLEHLRDPSNFPCPDSWSSTGLSCVMDVVEAPLVAIATEVEAMRQLISAVYRQRAYQQASIRLARAYPDAAAPRSLRPEAHGERGALTYTLPPDVTLPWIQGSNKPSLDDPTTAGLQMMAAQTELLYETDPVSRALAAELEAVSRPPPTESLETPPLAYPDEWPVSVGGKSFSVLEQDVPLPALLPYIQYRHKLYCSLFPTSESGVGTSAGPRGGGGAGRRASRSPSSSTVFFSKETFERVYAYYDSCDLLRRNPEYVRQMVPQKEAWTLLPTIDALVKLDRWLRSVQGMR